MSRLFLPVNSASVVNAFITFPLWLVNLVGRFFFSHKSKLKILGLYLTVWTSNLIGKRRSFTFEPHTPLIIIHAKILWLVSNDFLKHTFVTSKENQDSTYYIFWEPMFTFNPSSRISSALAPHTVQCTVIFSLRRMPNECTV